MGDDQERDVCMGLKPYRELRIVRKEVLGIKCKDGHYVKSKMEREVDDFLYVHGVAHELYPRIPNSTLKADFRAGDTYIEVWGLRGRKDYDERKEEKIAHYRGHNVRLIGIEPGQNIARMLGELVQQKRVDLDVFQQACKSKEIEEIDEEIGRLSERIEELRLRRNQIISKNVEALLKSKSFE